MKQAKSNLEPIERILNSDFIFGMTRRGGLFRGLVLSLTLGVIWGLIAFRSHQPGPGVFATLNLLFYPFHYFFDIRVFLVVVVGLVCIQLILVIVLILRNKTIKRVYYWLPLILALFLAVMRLLWGPYLYPPVWNLPSDTDFLLYLWLTLFSRTSVQYLLVVGVSLWIATYSAAVYLDDIYELNDVSVARRFILQAALGFKYNAITVEGGQILKKDEKSPIYKIGGPGVARINLNSAALFETIDGKPHVIGPKTDDKGKSDVLSGFERMRNSFDLSDQLEVWDVEERTQDGILIRLKDLKVIFSIYRGEQEATLNRPYPFEPLAIQRLVYGIGRTSWITSTKSLIRRKFGEFIAKHTLSEFLAAVGAPEQQEAQQEEAVLQQRLTRLAGVAAPAGAPTAGTLPNFLSRPDIMTELFAADFRREAARRGVEIKWIGGGTWELPDKVVPQRHLEAWKLSRENLLRGSQAALEKVGKESQVEEFTRLVQDVPVQTFTAVKGSPPPQALRDLIIAYQRVLNQAYEEHQRQPHDPAQQEWLRQVLVFLSRFIARWLGGP